MSFDRMEGWVPPEERTYEVAKRHDEIVSFARLFATAAAPLSDTGKGKVVLLCKALETVIKGPLPPRAQAIGDCFAAGTIVLGEQIKPIEQVAVGDMVWTAEGKQARVISTREIVTDKRAVTVKALGSMPIVCTEDHRFLVYRMGKVCGKRVTQKYYQRAMAGTAGVSPKVVERYNAREAVWVRASELQTTDYLLTPANIKQLPTPQDPFGFSKVEDGLFTLGYFLGDGHASGGTVEIVVASGEIQSRICKVFESLGYRYVVELNHKGSTANRIRVNSRELVSWFRETFYTNDKSKNFPGWAVGCSKVIEGLLESDGCDLKSEGFCIDTTSHSIAYGVFQSLACLGFVPSMGENKRTNTYANPKKLYRVIWKAEREREVVWTDGEYICRPVKSVSIGEPGMTVYDIGVEDDHHSFIANGVGVHNCVSWGFGHCVDVLSAVEIVLRGEAEQYLAECATEWIYGTSRVIQGGGRLRNSDGSLGSWAQAAVKENGTLIRKDYGSGVDLRKYSGDRAKDWGFRGLPHEMEKIADEHPVETTALVTSYEEARDSIANGYPVAVCSGVGFTMERDSEGFCRRKGSWAHCMAFTAVDDAHRRPGLLCQNSWGDYVGGPTRHGQPVGSFWVDADVADAMLRQNDSYALSGFKGYPKQVDKLDHRPW
jgi:hypothetical protein